MIELYTGINYCRLIKSIENRLLVCNEAQQYLLETVVIGLDMNKTGRILIGLLTGKISISLSTCLTGGHN